MFSWIFPPVTSYRSNLVLSVKNVDLWVELDRTQSLEVYSLCQVDTIRKNSKC
jgi:hypothetical protein